MKNYMVSKPLKVTTQMPPQVEKRYAMLGKVSDWAEASLDGSLDVKAIWSDFAVFVHTEADLEGVMGVKPATLLCEVEEDSTIKWNPAGLNIAGKSQRDAEEAVKKHRRQRK